MRHRTPALLALLLFFLSPAGLEAAERITFTGGHQMMVRDVTVVNDGRELEITLLEGGVIRMPRVAVEKREQMDPQEALAEWKRKHASRTVKGRDGESVDALGLSWERRMKVLESGPPPVDTGTEPEASLLYDNRNRRGATARSGSTSNLTPYGIQAPSDLPASPRTKRDLRHVPLRVYTPPHRGAASGVNTSRSVSPAVRAWKQNGYEPGSDKGPVGRDSLRRGSSK